MQGLLFFPRVLHSLTPSVFHKKYLHLLPILKKDDQIYIYNQYLDSAFTSDDEEKSGNKIVDKINRVYYNQAKQKDMQQVFAAQVLDAITKANAGGFRPSFESQVPEYEGRRDFADEVIRTKIRRGEIK